MTTMTQVKKLVRPLLERHQDLVLIGRWLFVKPVRHIVRGILIETTEEARRFRPRWAVTALCDRRIRIQLLWGESIYHPNIKLWFWDDPRMHSAFIEIIEEQTLQLLRSVNTLDDFIAVASDPELSFPLDRPKYGAAVVDAANGDLDSAGRLAPDLLSARYLWESLDSDRKNVETFCRLVQAGDQPNLANLLHEWEAFSVRQFGIEKIWEPTPFPLETGDRGVPSVRSTKLLSRDETRPMTWDEEVRELVEPLLQRHPDLALVGRWIVLTPVTHLLRAIVIDRTSIMYEFRPRTVVAHLFNRFFELPFNCELRLTDSKVKGWRWGDPRVPDAFLRAVEEQALPAFRSIQTLEDFVIYANSERFPVSPLDSYKIAKLVVDVARGDLEAARVGCRLLADGPQGWWDSPFYDFVMKNFCPLVAAGDRVALARLLHEWEAQKVKALKLEEYWEPTPFPLEMQDDSGGS